MATIGKEFDKAKDIASDAHGHLSQLKDDASRMVHQAGNVGRAGMDVVRDKAAVGSQVVRDKAAAGSQAVRDAADQAYSKGNDLLASLQKRIEENPAQAIAIAAGAGVLLGLLLRRKH